MKVYLVSCLVLIIVSAIGLSCYPAAKRPESSTTTQMRISMRYGIASGLCTYTRNHASLAQLQPPLNDPATFSSSKNQQDKCGSFLVWKKCAGKTKHCSQFECTSSTTPSKNESAETKIKTIKSSETLNGEYEGNPDENGEYFQGDINMSEMEMSNSRSGLIEEDEHWKNHTVVYEIQAGFTDDEIVLINASIKSIVDNTCLQFKVRTTERDYISVKSAPSGCNSRIGFQGGEQDLILGKTCLKKKVPAHEFIHALGFYHEQSRTDRDDYVTINFANIRPGKVNNFAKYDNGSVSPFGVSYDYDSIMHYSRYSFLRTDIVGPAETITPKQADAVIGQRDHLSKKDIQKINNMYGCFCKKYDVIT